jgi:hypothetical protein
VRLTGTDVELGDEGDDGPAAECCVACDWVEVVTEFEDDGATDLN